MMTIKDRISEHIKNLDKLEHYIKLCIEELNEYGTRTAGAGGPKYEKEGFGAGTRDLRTEIDKRINKIRDTRKFLYAIENFDLPLHKKILRNTLPILAITASWLLSFGLTAIFLFTIAIIAMTLMTTFPGWCTAMVAIPSLLFLSLFTFGINHELTDYFTSKQIIPIWNDNKFKQQGEIIAKINLNIDKSLIKNEVSLLYKTINFAKDIVYNLEQQEYNISSLLLKDEKELIELPEGIVVNDAKSSFDLKSESPAIKFFKRKANHVEESENHNISEVPRKRSRQAL